MIGDVISIRPISIDVDNTNTAIPGKTSSNAPKAEKDNLEAIGTVIFSSPRIFTVEFEVGRGSKIRESYQADTTKFTIIKRVEEKLPPVTE